MNSVQTIRLNLRAPLFYTADTGLVPFQYRAGGGISGEDSSGELLFCFELAADQSRSIEPDPAAFLKSLVFAGKLETPGSRSPVRQQAAPRQMELPAGNYLFAQERDALGREEFIQMAIEVQKDGLWERLALAGKLYLRYLHEDGRAVTQVFRPCGSVY
jgi:hypothetical protein